MSIKDRLANKASTIGSNPRVAAEPAAPGKPKTGAGQLMQSLPMLAEKDSEIAALKKQLDIATENAASREIPLSELNEVPGRRRKLTATQFAELRENLRNNTLISAITVRVRPEGGYEIISGHNRVAVFRELGREKILAVAVNANDAETDLGAFYANLLQSNLPDYEKFLGFRRRQAVTGMTQTQLAAEAGVSAAFVSQLMTFEDLPESVTAILDERPELVGANAAEDFAKLIKQGRQEEVVAAIGKIAAEGITQAAALRLASQTAKPSVRTEATKIKAGRFVFAELRCADKTMRISFRSPEEREAAEAEIEALIRQIAARAGKGSGS